MKTAALFGVGLLLIFGTMLAAQTPGPCLGVSGTAYVNWPQFHSDVCHTGYNASEFILSTANVGNMVLDWKYDTGIEIDLSSPTVANGVVYIGDQFDGVYALNALTGAPLWHYTTGDIVYSSPSVANGVVYFGSYDHNVYALNALTGAKLWNFTAGDVVSASAAVANGVVYIGSWDHNVYALNATTGAEIWSYDTGYQIEFSPAVANGAVYVGVYLTALDAATGGVLWGSNLPSGDSSPAIANGVVYVGSDLGSVHALNAATGPELWNFAIGNGAGVRSSPAVVNGMLYVGAGYMDGNLYAFHLPD